MARKDETALDRLNRLSEPSNEREYTLEEQMDSVSTDDFLDGMSVAAKNQLGHLFEEVTISESNDSIENRIMETQVPDSNQNPTMSMDLTNNELTDIAEDDTSNDELFNNNMKPKRKYTKRSQVENTQQVEDTKAKDSTVRVDYSSNPVFDQVAKDLIDDLRNSKYKINRFDDKSMEMIFDYMYNKF